MQPYGPPPGHPGYGRQPHQQQAPYGAPPQYGAPQYGAPPPQPPSPNAAPPMNAAPKPLARLPLQIGTTATWGAARAAVALFPGLAIVAAGIAAAVGGEIEGGIAIIVFGGLLVVYACWHLWIALKTRASDVLLHIEGVHVDGGRLNGSRFGWNELQAPFAQVEQTTATRLIMWRIFAFALSIASRSRNITSPVAQVTVWKLWLHRNGNRQLVAETDRPIEASSLSAAASSIEAVMNGRKYVHEAPTIATQVTTCNACGAPAVPDDAPAVVCAYCKQWVPLPPHVRGQAAAARAMQTSRATTQKMIAKLLEQPRATTTNGWLLFFTLLMFGAWPIGWGIIGYHILDDGFQPLDVAFLALPFAAVLGGFFFARGRLADRGALQLLTLGFGALAPRRDGEPSRCRRCQGPLPDAGLGGVTQCRYCHAENIVGLDLRPSVDPARAEQSTFDDALKKRGREKLLWGIMTGFAVLALLGWIGGTIFYAID